ncbi:MAG: aldehyde ferredoxin oxidoreductase family protein [Ruminococcaceae bacterium]|nr:aldehyde ferredoxin oxidoreductase family protein [Oscillospiraceae bacterium]
MSRYFGYMGKVLKIDLTNKTFGEFPWSDEDRERTIGGKIMAGEILYRHIKKGMTAFDEDNWIVITTGPLTGCGVPSSSRFNISTISPLTGLITSSNSGGDFGLMLKRCGYDGAVITGRATTPTRIHITQKNVEFLDASDIWGMECSPAQEALPKGTAKLVIGPAGENKVLYAAVLSGERCSGRGGVGAVFGDKMIKAITAKGFKHPMIAYEEELRKLSKKWTKNMRKHPISGRQLSVLGTAGLVSPMQARGLLATKNFEYGKFDDFDMVSGETLAEEKLVRNSGCTTCVMQCTRRCMHEGKEIKGPELEVIGLMGPNLMNNDLQKIIEWNYEIDEMGMDTISTAGTIAFAMELNEKGFFDSGLEFGKNDNITQMIHDIAHRRGVGDELANGSKKMAEKFGGMEFAIQSKGMELSAYEPRRAVGQGLGYATSNRGGCHLNAGYLVFVEGLGLDIDSLTPRGKGALCVMFQNLMEAISAAGLCLFTSYPIFPGYVFDHPNAIITKVVTWVMPYLGPIVKLMNLYGIALQLYIPLIPHTRAIKLATGMKMNLGKFLVAGERGYNIERVANMVLGQKPGADKLPKKLTETLQDPNNPMTKVPLDVMLNSYYKNRQWKNGAPTRKVLERLKIDIPPVEDYPYAY